MLSKMTTSQNYPLVSLANNVKLGENVKLEPFVCIRDNVTIGDNVWIKEYTCIYSGAKLGSNIMIRAQGFICENARIGNKVEMGVNVKLVNHKKLCRYNPKQEDVVTSPQIGSGVRIGSDVLLMPGVKIGDNSIIMGNSTVYEDVPSKQIWGGDPAKFIKNVASHLIIEDLE